MKIIDNRKRTLYKDLYPGDVFKEENDTTNRTYLKLTKDATQLCSGDVCYLSPDTPVIVFPDVELVIK